MSPGSRERESKSIDLGKHLSPHPVSSPALSAWRAAHRCRRQFLHPPRAARAPQRASPPRRPGSMTTVRRRRCHAVGRRRCGLEEKEVSRRWRPAWWNPRAGDRKGGSAPPQDGAEGAPALEPGGSARGERAASLFSELNENETRDFFLSRLARTRASSDHHPSQKRQKHPSPGRVRALLKTILRLHPQSETGA